MEDTTQEKAVDDLLEDAKLSLVDLLDFSGVGTDQWFMHLYPDTGSGWKLLSNDAGKNNAAIRGSIQQAKEPVTSLALAFCGMAEVKGERQQVAYTQYFRQGYDSGLVLGRRIRKRWLTGQLRSHGSFLIMGQCHNIWL